MRTDPEWPRADPTGEPWRISTADVTDDTHRTVVVQTYADVLKTFSDHPEAKYNDSHGQPCVANTTGALHRRHIQPRSVAHIGKEADKIDKVQAGLVTDTDDILTTYNPHDSFHDRVLPLLDHMTAPQVADRVMALTQQHSHAAVVRAVQRARRGTVPRGNLRRVIVDIALLEGTPLPPPLATLGR